MAKVIVFEGIDGAGKSTQIAKVFDGLIALGHKVMVCREPGSTPTAEDIRNVLKNRPYNDEMTITTETLLMFAARAQLVPRLKSLIAEYDYVLLDRWYHSSYAYQCIGKGFEVDKFFQLLGMSGALDIQIDGLCYLHNDKQKEADDSIEQSFADTRHLVKAAYDDLFLNQKLYYMPEFDSTYPIACFSTQTDSIERTRDLLLEFILEL